MKKRIALNCTVSGMFKKALRNLLTGSSTLPLTKTWFQNMLKHKQTTTATSKPLVNVMIHYLIMHGHFQLGKESISSNINQSIKRNKMMFTSLQP